MEIKLFGKSLFEIKKTKTEVLIGQAVSAQKESKFLIDFYAGWNEGSSLSEYVSIDSVILRQVDAPENKTAKQVVEDIKKNLTPKDVFTLKMLNNSSFTINVDPAYVESQLASFKDKLGMIKTEEYDMRRGVSEISSVVSRLENRKKYAGVREFFEQYPYTTTSKIKELEKNHDYLKLGQIAQFIADLPKEAIDTMKKYNKQVDELCGKQAVFYILADKKDFKVTTSRRDPILLVQSPFAHVWQICGAWDKEMLFLEEI